MPVSSTSSKAGAEPPAALAAASHDGRGSRHRHTAPSAETPTRSSSIDCPSTLPSAAPSPLHSPLPNGRAAAASDSSVGPAPACNFSGGGASEQVPTCVYPIVPGARRHTLSEPSVWEQHRRSAPGPPLLPREHRSWPKAGREAESGVEAAGWPDCRSNRMICKQRKGKKAPR
jgi:hypothetical protein